MAFGKCGSARVLLECLQLQFGWEEKMEDYSKYLSFENFENIVYALIILVLGRIIVGILTRVIRRLMVRNKIEETLTKFVVSLTKVALLTFVVIAAIRQLGVETNSFVAIIGAAGLAVGFALQGTLANFAAGVMLIIFKPFKAGDFIEGGGSAGTVDAVQIFNTILKSPDNRKIIIPNSKLTGDNIINYSAMEQRRIDLVFGIGYDDDIKKAKATLEKILSEDERVLKDPAPTVAVLELGDSSINFVVRPWVKTSDYWAVYFDVTEKVKLTFDNEGISIPFPQRDIHLYEEKAS
jgi:small conductance mechanosensitive channel